MTYKTRVTILDLSALQEFALQFGFGAFANLCRQIEIIFEMEDWSHLEWMHIFFNFENQSVPGCTYLYHFKFEFRFRGEDKSQSCHMYIGRYTDPRPHIGYTFYLSLTYGSPTDCPFSSFEHMVPRLACEMIGKQWQLNESRSRLLTTARQSSLD